MIRVAFSESDALIPDGPSCLEGLSWKGLLLERLTCTVAEVATLLGTSRASAYECVRSGEIPAVMLGHRLVISRAAIDHLFANSPRPAGGRCTTATNGPTTPSSDAAT